MDGKRGPVSGQIVLRNPLLPDLDGVETPALADSGAVHLCIPEHVRRRLHLDAISQKQVKLADGSSRRVPYVGPVEIRFKDRIGFSGALVTGDEVLLGSVPMAEMDLVVRNRALTPN